MSRTTIKTIAAAALLAAGAPVAWSQDATPKPAAPDDAILRGPEVKDESLPGQRGKFSAPGAKGPDRKSQERPIPMRLFIQAVGVLKQDSTPQNARLTAEQETELRKIGDEFRNTMAAYIREHRDETQSLRAQLGPEARKAVEERLRNAGFPADARKELKKSDAKSSNQSPASDAMMTDPAPDPAKEQAAVARLKELFENAPSAQDAQKKAWAVLTEAQRPIVQQELERQRKESARPPKPVTNKSVVGEVAGKPAGVDGIDLDRLPPRIRERLEQLPPEKRQEAIEKLRQRAGERGLTSRKDAAKAADDKARAPGMEDVQVPAPEQDKPKR